CGHRELTERTGPGGDGAPEAGWPRADTPPPDLSSVRFAAPSRERTVLAGEGSDKPCGTAQFTAVRGRPPGVAFAPGTGAKHPIGGAPGGAMQTLERAGSTTLTCEPRSAPAPAG